MQISQVLNQSLVVMLIKLSTDLSTQAIKNKKRVLPARLLPVNPTI